MKSKRARVGGHLVGVAGVDHLVGAQAQGVLGLRGRGREHHDVGAERARELDAHVAQAAQPHDAHLLAGRDAPVAHGRVGGDARAQQRRDPGQVEVRRHPQHEALVDDDALGVPAEGDPAQVLVRRVVGEHAAGAELLHVRLAGRAGVVRIDEAADPDHVAGLVGGDRRPDRRHPADDLVTRHHRIDRGHEGGPLVAHRVQVRVADAAEEDLDLHVGVGDGAALDGIGLERGRGAGGGIGPGLRHGRFSCRSGTGPKAGGDASSRTIKIN